MIGSARREELVNLCREFVKIPSPSGHERQLAGFVRECMSSLGFEDVRVDYYGSVTGNMDFGDGPCLVLEAQLDHVNVDDPFKWKYYPFGGFIADGKIYGRGATDQKGSLAAMLCAAAFLKDDWGKRLSGRLVVSATVHQERFEGASSRLVDEAWSPDFVVTGEASGLALERGQRGRAEIVVEVAGKPAHSARPEYGINAASRMASLVCLIVESFSPAKDAFLGEGILELTNLVSFPQNSTGQVPSSCRAVFDRRLLPGESRTAVLQQVQRILKEAESRIPDLKAKAWIPDAADRCYTGARILGDHFAPAWLFPEDHLFIKACLEGLAKAGLEPRLAKGPGFGTNGCYYGGVKGVPTVVFGPSSENLAHVDDEYIEVEELVAGCRGYYGIAAEVLSREWRLRTRR